MQHRAAQRIASHRMINAGLRWRAKMLEFRPAQENAAVGFHGNGFGERDKRVKRGDADGYSDAFVSFRNRRHFLIVTRPPVVFDLQG